MSTMMLGEIPRDPESQLEPAAILEPLKIVKSRWPIYVSGALSLLLLAGLGYQLLGNGLGALQSNLPSNPLFYVALLAAYSALPVADFTIFRRLWGLPYAGIVPVLRKLVANEVLLGYSGEAYFYAWARAHSQIVAAPFAAIKDVSILSAVVGNVMTLVMMAVAAPVALTLLPETLVKPILYSAGTVIGGSMIILLFRGRLFSLPRKTLGWIFSIHALRTFAYTLLMGLCWHFALPTVSLGLWLMLIACKHLVSRLPFVPNKDLMFANLAVLLVGNDVIVSNLIALTVALTLVLHGIVLAATWLLTFKRSET